jgi:hypothetical protein
MRTPLEYIIPSLVSKLRSDTELSDMVKGIFDDVPSNQEFPFVVIGQMSELPFNTFGRSGRRTTVTVNVLSRYQGFKEATLIYARINEILEGDTISLPNHNLVSLQFVSNQLIQDGDLRHIPIVYELVTQEVKE